MLVLTWGTLSAQEESPDPEPSKPAFRFGMDINLGVETIPEADGSYGTYQLIDLQPVFQFGNLGIGLSLGFHLSSTGSDSFPVTIRKEDWVPSDGQTWGEIILSKFNFIRWGFKGDPLYVRLGSISDGILGTGFIMGNYRNTLLRPAEKPFGLNLDMDGKLFNFPYLGFESLVGNLAAWDVMGLRIYSHPLVTLGGPIFRNLEVGFTLAGDRSPAFRENFFLSPGSPYDLNNDGQLDETIEPVLIWGIDLIQPILSGPLFSLSAFAAMATQPRQASGSMIGVGGRIITVLPYMLQLRFLGENFQPTYFDSTYDLYRADKYAVVSGKIDTPRHIGWAGSLGFSLFEDGLSLFLVYDAPFSSPPANTANHAAGEFPHFRISFRLAQGLLPGIYCDAFYDKPYITRFADLWDPEGAAIGANINYQAGTSVITLAYAIKYNPAVGKLESTARLSVGMGLF
jgi:hypothetical protein